MAVDDEGADPVVGRRRSYRTRTFNFSGPISDELYASTLTSQWFQLDAREKMVTHFHLWAPTLTLASLLADVKLKLLLVHDTYRLVWIDRDRWSPL